MAVPTSNIISEVAGANFLSKWSDLLDSNFHKKVFKQYGVGVTFTNMLHAANRTEAVPSQDMKVVEEQFLERPIKLKSAVSAGNAGEAITVVLHADNYDANSRNPIRLYDLILVPHTYVSGTEDMVYQVTARSTATLAYDTLTCTPFRNGTTYTKAQITTAIPAGTYLMIAGNAFARGTGQPEGKTDTPTTHIYTSGITKETKGFDGATLAHKMQVGEYDGQRWMISDSMVRGEFDLEGNMDKQITFGMSNDNASLVQTADFSSDSNAVRSTMGVIPWLNQSAQTESYVNTFKLTDLRTTQLDLESQGVYNSSAGFFVGPDLAQQLYDECLDYFREYSGGSDLYDGASGKLGVTPRALEYGGVTYYIQPMASLSNPSTYGLNPSGSYSYQFPTAGVVVPDIKVTVPKWGEKSDYTIPNLGLGYVNYNGENRERIMKYYLGMNGVFNSSQVAADTDGYKLFWMSEFMLFGAEWNKMVYWTKQA